MLDAARRAFEFVADIDVQTFAASELHQSAVIRQLEVIGEAARAISDETKATNTAIPWSTIGGMRNILLHEYFRVDVTRVWETVRDDIPPLIAALEAIVPPDD